MLCVAVAVAQSVNHTLGSRSGSVFARHHDTVNHTLPHRHMQVKRNAFTSHRNLSWINSSLLLPMLRSSFSSSNDDDDANDYQTTTTSNYTDNNESWGLVEQWPGGDHHKNRSQSPSVSFSTAPFVYISTPAPFQIIMDPQTDVLIGMHSSAQALSTMHSSAQALSTTHSAQPLSTTHSRAQALSTTHSSAQALSTTHSSAQALGITHSAQALGIMHSSAQALSTTHSSAQALSTTHSSAQTLSTTHSAQALSITHSAQALSTTHSAQALSTTHSAQALSTTHSAQAKITGSTHPMPRTLSPTNSKSANHNVPFFNLKLLRVRENQKVSILSVITASSPPTSAITTSATAAAGNPEDIPVTMGGRRNMSSNGTLLRVLSLQKDSHTGMDMGEPISILLPPVSHAPWLSTAGRQRDMNTSPFPKGHALGHKKTSIPGTDPGNLNQTQTSSLNGSSRSGMMGGMVLGLLLFSITLALVLKVMLGRASSPGSYNYPYQHHHTQQHSGSSSFFEHSEWELDYALHHLDGQDVAKQKIG